MKKEPLIRVENMKKYYPVKGGIIPHTTGCIKAVDGVSFSIMKGETLGLVGESGCGKSTIGRQLVGLETPTEGSIYYKGMNLSEMKKEERRKIRTNLQMVFQDSYSSLNPRKHVFEILAQPMLYHKISTKETVEKDVIKLLDMVGLPTGVLGRYPHEFSGGQRQRVAIARMLLQKAPILVFDDSLSAVDSETDSLIRKALGDEMEQATVILISHRITTLMGADQILVLNQGQAEEMGTHYELIRKQGIYRRIYEIQMSQDDREQMKTETDADAETDLRRRHASEEKNNLRWQGGGAEDGGI